LTCRSHSEHPELLSNLSPFPIQQPAFAFIAPPVSAQTAVAPNHTVARDDNGNRIGGAGLGYSTGGIRIADTIGYFPITCRLAGLSLPSVSDHSYTHFCPLDCPILMES
jgi:hypothetical protein